MNNEPIFEKSPESPLRTNIEQPNEFSDQPINESQSQSEADYSKAIFYDENPDVRKAELMERLKVKSKILQYQQTFPDELLAYNYKMNQLDQFSTEDLRVFLDEVKIVVSQRNSTGLAKFAYFSAVDVIEKIGCKIGYDIKGFKNILNANPEIHKCLNEIALEYADMIYVSPHIRLSFLTLSVATNLYQMKKVENVVEKEIQKKIPDDIREMYNDL